MYVIAAVAVIAVAAVAVFLVMNNSGSEDHGSKSSEDTRLRIYGNANGDDQIDKTDLSTDRNRNLTSIMPKRPPSPIDSYLSNVRNGTRGTDSDII